MEYANALRDEFGPMGYQLPTKNAYDWVVRLGGWFNDEMAYIANKLSINFSYDNKKTVEKLGIQFEGQSLEKVLSIMTHDMIEHGMLEDKRPRV